VAEATSYDSRRDTLDHIVEVRQLLAAVIVDLQIRAEHHDESKMVEPELAVFNEYTPKLRDSTYGSEEYKRFLLGMGEGLKHHYRQNDHHPEHFENGMRDMDLIQVLEMLADWKAATLRHADGDLGRSIVQNSTRFDYGPEVRLLLYNTAKRMGWL
jgi:hypothetical protein